MQSSQLLWQTFTGYVTPCTGHASNLDSRPLRPAPLLTHLLIDLYSPEPARDLGQQPAHRHHQDRHHSQDPDFRLCSVQEQEQGQGKSFLSPFLPDPDHKYRGRRVGGGQGPASRDHKLLILYQIDCSLSFLFLIR